MHHTVIALLWLALCVSACVPDPRSRRTLMVGTVCLVLAHWLAS